MCGHPRWRCSTHGFHCGPGAEHCGCPDPYADPPARAYGVDGSTIVEVTILPDGTREHRAVIVDE